MGFIRKTQRLNLFLTLFENIHTVIHTVTLVTLVTLVTRTQSQLQIAEDFAICNRNIKKYLGKENYRLQLLKE